jgi:hypothetical protein
LGLLLPLEELQELAEVLALVYFLFLFGLDAVKGATEEKIGQKISLVYT